MRHQVGGNMRILGMRDIDAQFATVIVARRGEPLEDLATLSRPRVAFGSRDSGHAAILPMHFMREAGRRR